ncbi:hypothetical protein LguiA_008392 [Lonicera macranthoides]
MFQTPKPGIETWGSHLRILTRGNVDCIEGVPHDDGGVGGATKEKVHRGPSLYDFLGSGYVLGREEEAKRFTADQHFALGPGGPFSPYRLLVLPTIMHFHLREGLLSTGSEHGEPSFHSVGQVHEVRVPVPMSHPLAAHRHSSSRHSLLGHTEDASSAASEAWLLVHGRGLGAWSWFKVVPRLWSYGHKVTAIDLAASGIDPRQVTDIPSIADSFKPLRHYMAALPSQEKVILVGHSRGGLAISQSMELFPQKIKVAVFVTAFMPGPNYNISQLNRDLAATQNFSQPDNRYLNINGTTAFLYGPKYLRKYLFQNSPIEDWVLATLLTRPSRVYSEQDMSNVLKLSTEKYGSVNRVFIISGQDKLLVPSFQQLMVTRNPPTEVQEIATSDHIVMLSRVDELSDWILATLLVRPLPLYSDQDMENVLMLSSNKYGSVKRAFIISEQDNVIIPNFQRLMIMKNPPTKVQKILTSDHMVMISKPFELPVRLNNIAQKHRMQCLRRINQALVKSSQSADLKNFQKHDRTWNSMIDHGANQH